MQRLCTETCDFLHCDPADDTIMNQTMDTLQGSTNCILQILASPPVTYDEAFKQRWNFPNVKWLVCWNDVSACTALLFTSLPYTSHYSGPSIAQLVVAPADFQVADHLTALAPCLMSTLLLGHGKCRSDV